MATMVKEKHRQKKKSKAKNVSESSKIDLPCSTDVDESAPHLTDRNIDLPAIEKSSNDLTVIDTDINPQSEMGRSKSTDVKNTIQIDDLSTNTSANYDPSAKVYETEEKTVFTKDINRNSNIDTENNPNLIRNFCEANFEPSKGSSNTSTFTNYGESQATNVISVDDSCSMIDDQDKVTPSAPVFKEAEELPLASTFELVQNKTKLKLQCMPLEKAIFIFGGKEICEVKEISELEEAIVEKGPHSGPEHPLVDLLSTFKSSLSAVERERNRISSGYRAEEKFRSTLWKVEKKSVNVTEKCLCGRSVVYRAEFEHAELLKEKLPAAYMKLELLLRDVKDSYCYHQHAAILAYYQIEELLNDQLEKNKSVIRESLALILQALRLSDGSSNVYVQTLQRWATALSYDLLTGNDIQQLLYLLHQLFRQTLSVRWAENVVRMRLADMPAAARLVAILDVLLVQPAVDAAVECTEGVDSNESETWEELDARGEGGAVGGGRLREQDLLALMRSLPLQELLTTLVTFPKANSEYAGLRGDSSHGHAVLRSCCGVRALLHVCARALQQHAAYARLTRLLRRYAATVLRSLAFMDSCCRYSYEKEGLTEEISIELEACFSAGVVVLAEDLHDVPATLLMKDTAKDYCNSLITGLHEGAPRPVDSLEVELPALACERRVRAAAAAAVDRVDDEQLSCIVFEFLIQTGIKPMTVVCKGSCDVAARALLPGLLAAHPHLYGNAFRALADLNHVVPAESSAVLPQLARQWRPAPAQAAAVLRDAAQRCPPLLQRLLLQLDCSPDNGVSFETQLVIGSWLCEWACGKGEAPEWAWTVLRRLRLHRSFWGLPLEAPTPDGATINLFAAAYALLACDLGHSLPLICGAGAELLRRVADARAADALHCLCTVMRVLVQSPESISLTPAFVDILTVILNWKPPLVQRALGRGGLSGADMLQRLILDQLEDPTLQGCQSALLAAWMHALWKCALPAAGRGVLDAVLRARRDWQALDAHVAFLLQEDSNQYVNDSVSHVAAAPLLCEAVLRGAHARELRGLSQRLLPALAQQRAARARPHVDQALRLIGATIGAESLVIYRTAAAVLGAGAAHPSHLTLWQLLLHLYLQRPPDTPLETTPPVGPLFFSGIVKSRTLSHLKKRLLETVTYHRNEAASLKAQQYLPVTGDRSDVTNSSEVVEDNIFPALTLADFAMNQEHDSEVSSPNEERDILNDKKTSETEKRHDIDMRISYHVQAAKLLDQYNFWIEEGDNVRACPHHVNMNKLISEKALEAAWNASLEQAMSISICDSPPTTPQASPERILTLHEQVDMMIREIKNESSTCYPIPEIGLSIPEIDFNDSRSLLHTVDHCIATIEQYSTAWCGRVERTRALDAQLWEHVRALRVRRPVPSARRACSQACAPITLHVQEDEWCLSSNAELRILENRRSARAALRQLAGAQPAAAHRAATLLSIARRVRSKGTATRVLERAWGSAEHAHAPAHRSLVAVVTLLAERWLCQDGEACAQLIARWSLSGAHALCSALVQPAREHVASWMPLYIALLRVELPASAAFSYLSKFDMAYWADHVDSAQRLEVLEELMKASQRWMQKNNKELLMLIELAGVQCAAVARASELAVHISRCSRACAALSVAPVFAAHLSRLASSRAHELSFDQLGHLMRDLGETWWAARAQAQAQGAAFAPYAPHFAALLRELQRAFVAAAEHLTYAPEKISVYAWSSIRDSWAPWVLPHSAAPLLPSTADGERYTDMLDDFADTVEKVMEDCPSCKEHLLRQVWEWAVQGCLAAARAGAPQEARVQRSALLARLARLPWHHAWFNPDCLPLACQISCLTDREITSWTSSTWRCFTADTCLRGVRDDQLVPTLAAFFSLFTSKNLQLSEQALEEACEFPWYRLPQEALDQLLERFFMEHHDTVIPYHETPQFRVVLAAGQLRAPAAPGPRAAESRERAVSQWVRAAAAPALAPHVRAHTQCLLNIVTQLAPHVGHANNELEELLSRAVVILCVEPAATAALSVWEQWAGCCASRLRLAGASAAVAVTDGRRFASLADAIAKAELADNEGGGWAALRARWAACPWADAMALAARAPHAAYALMLTHAQSPSQLRHALAALGAGDMSFTENEVIVALWICAAARIGRECAARVEDAGGSVAGGERGVTEGERVVLGPRGEDAEVAAAALALVAGWAEQKRSLLRLLALQADNTPTPRHRLLCNLAQCILTPSEAAAKSYEAACYSVLGSNPGDVIAWGRTPNPKGLPRLSMRLYPQSDMYFKEELDLAPDVVHPDS